MKLRYATIVRPYTDGFGFGCCLPLNSIQIGFPAAPQVTPRSQQLIRGCPAITLTSCTFPAMRHFSTRSFLLITPILAGSIFETVPETFYSEVPAKLIIQLKRSWMHSGGQKPSRLGVLQDAPPVIHRCRVNGGEAISMNLPAHIPVPLSVRFAASQYRSNSSNGVVFISETFASTYSNRFRKRRFAILRASSGLM